MAICKSAAKVDHSDGEPEIGEQVASAMCILAIRADGPVFVSLVERSRRDET